MRASNFAFFAIQQAMNLVTNNFLAKIISNLITKIFVKILLKSFLRIFGVNNTLRFFLYFEQQDPAGIDPVVSDLEARNVPSPQLSLPENAAKVAPTFSLEQQQHNKYNFVRMLLPEIEAGKNEGGCLVFSLPKDGSTNKKLGIAKPLYDPVVFNDRGILKESRSLITDATSEVFAAWISVLLSGKEHAAKTKFNIEKRGVVSRIVGDEFEKTINLFNYFVDDDGKFFAKNLPTKAQASLLFVLVLNIILTNRDMHIDNMILNFKDPDNPFVYTIDNEFALAASRRLEATFTLKKLLHLLYEDPRYFAKVCFDVKCKWNDSCGYDLTPDQLNLIADKMCGFITKEAFVATLNDISSAIAANDFAMCTTAKEKTLKQLQQAPELYPPQEIEDLVIPRIDSAIMELKRSVKVVQLFLEKLRASAENTTESTQSGTRYNMS